MTVTRSVRNRAVSAIVFASFASVLPSPANAPAIRFTNRPGTYRTGCPVCHNNASNNPAVPDVMSNAQDTSPPALPARAISASIAACPFAVCWLNTTFPVSSTAHAWCDAFPTSIPTQIRSRTFTIRRPPTARRDPVDNPASSSINSDHAHRFQSAARASKTAGRPLLRKPSTGKQPSATPRRSGHLKHQPQTPTTLWRNDERTVRAG